MTDGLTGADALDGHVDRPTGEAVRAGGQIGARLAMARKRAGLTGAELGAALGLRKDQISKIESGKRRLDVGELALAASALGVSVPALLGQEERTALAMAARLTPDGGSEGNRVARRRARQLLEIDDLLTQVVGMPPARSSEQGDRVLTAARAAFMKAPRTKSAAREQGRQLAELTRQYLDLGSDALGDLAGLIEQHFAVDVALSPFGTQADGLCVHSGDVALILASTDFSDGHLRFTLAHELGHHLLGDPREVIDETAKDMFADTATEWRANAFAGHLLMPDRGVRSVLDWLGEVPKAISERGIAALMEHFGVSMAALLYQLNLLGLMSFGDSQALRDSHKVHLLVARNRDVAPKGAATLASHARRPPERLTRHALAAARSQKLGLGLVAALLERDDDDQLWSEVMDGDVVMTAVLPDDVEL